jgi:hypothetical protein
MKMARVSALLKEVRLRSRSSIVDWPGRRNTCGCHTTVWCSGFAQVGHARVPTSGWSASDRMVKC